MVPLHLNIYTCWQICKTLSLDEVSEFLALPIFCVCVCVWVTPAKCLLPYHIRVCKSRCLSFLIGMRNRCRKQQTVLASCFPIEWGKCLFECTLFLLLYLWMPFQFKVMVPENTYSYYDDVAIPMPSEHVISILWSLGNHKFNVVLFSTPPSLEGFLRTPSLCVSLSLSLALFLPDRLCM